MISANVYTYYFNSEQNLAVNFGKQYQSFFGNMSTNHLQDAWNKTVFH